MSRWIDAEELMRLLQNYRPFVESGRFNALQTQADQLVDCIEYEIEDAPSIEIVRCKECKDFARMMGDFEHLGDCNFLNKRMKVDDFCSYGEREGE